MVKPIKEGVKAKRHTPQYLMHKYFARRPYNVFNKLVDHYSDPGDIILDCFCGGGVTVSEGLALDRKVIGVDINPLATFITEMQIKQVDVDDLREYFDNFYYRCEEKLKEYYQINISGKKANIEWIEWVYSVKCPECGETIVLSEDNKISSGKYKCSNPQCMSNKTEKKGVKRTNCKPFSSLPIRIQYINEQGEKNTKLLTDNEVKKIQKEYSDIKLPKNSVKVDFDIPKNWDRWYEDCLPQKGIYKFSDLFTRKNFFCNTYIFNKILSLPQSEERDLLYFAFSSSLRYTNNMSRVTANWENGKPTCMDKHAYWLPNVYVECNVLQKLKERMNAVIKGVEYTNSYIKNKKEKADSYKELINNKDYLVLTQSSDALDIPDESVSAVITDPPYGSNVQYGELSSFWNIWYKQYKGLDNFIYNEEEAVSNRKHCFEGSKTVEFYGKMLESVFAEANRVLKQDGYLVFTFNNKNINVWIQMLKAVVKAGFYLPNNGVIYQDFVESYKNTSHLKYSGNIQGDFIYSFKKGKVKNLKFNIDSFEKKIVKKIDDCIEKMYKKDNAYTTTELYETIFSNITRIIVDYVSNASDEELSSVQEFSKSYIDELLKKKLKVVDGKWLKREEK